MTQDISRQLKTANVFGWVSEIGRERDGYVLVRELNLEGK